MKLGSVSVSLGRKVLNIGLSFLWFKDGEGGGLGDEKQQPKEGQKLSSLYK